MTTRRPEADALRGWMAQQTLVAVSAAFAIVVAGLPSRAQEGRPPPGFSCSRWGRELRCGAAKQAYSCRDAAVGDVAPSPGAEKILACHPSGDGSKAPAVLVVLSREGTVVDARSHGTEPWGSDSIGSVEVVDVVAGSLREVVVEHGNRPSPTIGASSGKAAVQRRDLSVLRWTRGGGLGEVFKACLMQRPQPVTFARAAKVSYEKGSAIRVRAKQQEYYGGEVRQWWSDVTYAWSRDAETYVASSCSDLADPLLQTLGPDEPEGDVNKGISCIAVVPIRPARPPSVAPQKNAQPAAPQKNATSWSTGVCRAPESTALVSDPIVVFSNDVSDCPRRAVQTARERRVTIDVSGRSCGEALTHRESFAVEGDRACSYEIVLRGRLEKGAREWVLADDAVELRSHCERGTSCGQGLTTATETTTAETTTAETTTAETTTAETTTAETTEIVAPAVVAKGRYTTSQCLRRLQGEVDSGRLLRECYDRIAGEADNEALTECNVGELSRSLCRGDGP